MCHGALVHCYDAIDKEERKNCGVKEERTSPWEGAWGRSDVARGET